MEYLQSDRTFADMFKERGRKKDMEFLKSTISELLQNKQLTDLDGFSGMNLTQRENLAA